MAKKKFDAGMAWIGDEWRDYVTMKARLEQEMRLKMDQAQRKIRFAVVQERAKGKPFSLIVNSTGISHMTLRRWVEAYELEHGGLPEALPDEVTDNRTAEEKYGITEDRTLKDRTSDPVDRISYTKGEEVVWVIEGQHIGRGNGHPLPGGIPEWFVEDVPAFLNEKYEDERGNRITGALQKYRSNGLLREQKA